MGGWCFRMRVCGAMVGPGCSVLVQKGACAMCTSAARCKKLRRACVHAPRFRYLKCMEVIRVGGVCLQKLQAAGSRCTVMAQ